MSLKPAINALLQHQNELLQNKIKRIESINNEKNTMTTNNTPTPWEYIVDMERIGHIIIQKKGGIVCIVSDQIFNAEANARHIVKCVNSHEALLNAVIKLTEAIESSCGWNATNLFKEDFDNLIEQSERE